VGGESEGVVEGGEIVGGGGYGSRVFILKLLLHAALVRWFGW